MKRLVRAALAFALPAALLAAGPARAEPWKLDQDHSHVSFMVNNIGFSWTQGQFREFDATIDFDPENVEEASVTFTLKAASVDTKSKARDDNLLAPEFLDAGRYPDITFRSTKVRLIDDKTAEVLGDMTMKGHTQEETFTATLVRIGPSPFNPKDTIAGFIVEGKLDRTDYGVSFGAPAIGAEVQIRVDLQINPVDG